MALISFSVSAMMTWIVQPQLARLLEGWLYAPAVQVRSIGHAEQLAESVGSSATDQGLMGIWLFGRR